MDIQPKSFKKSSKPNLFCPGCGHGIVLKQLGFLIDELGIQKETTFGIDIGCSLLAWDFFDIDTFQTHHGRAVPVMVGYKMAEPARVTLAYMGDGGAYAIGLQSLLHAAHRNDPITAIVINNANYGMTGGQMSPTTPIGMATKTTPKGRSEKFGMELKGAELVAAAADEEALVIRASVSNPVAVKNALKKAIEHQREHNSFALVEILSICPTNWKTDAVKSFEVLKGMEEKLKIGEIGNNKE